MSVVLYWGGGEPTRGRKRDKKLFLDQPGSRTQNLRPKFGTRLREERAPGKLRAQRARKGGARHERPGSRSRRSFSISLPQGPAGLFLSCSRRAPLFFFYLAPAGSRRSFSISLPQGPAGPFLSRSRRVPPSFSTGSFSISAAARHAAHVGSHVGRVRPAPLPAHARPARPL